MNILQQANELLRLTKYEDAIRFYVDALQAYKPLAHVILPNLKYAQSKRLRDRALAPRQRVMVCGWDLSRNAAGRVVTLAQIYEPFAEVEIIGCFFSRIGCELWPPIRNIAFPVHSILVEDESNFLQQAAGLVLQHPCDLLHLSKPRFPNILIGMLYKLIWGSRVLVDIDDEELAFVSASESISLDDYIKTHHRLPNPGDLAGKDWTRIAVGLAKTFDGVTVVNSALQQRYGGTIVRHARDEAIFKPSEERRQKSRTDLGIAPEQKVILFLGTPRAHKGLLEIAQAVAQLKRDDVLFMIVGDFPCPLQGLKAQIESMPNLNCRLLSDLPFEKIPDILAAGDMCVLLQDPDSLAAQYQTPAKLSDALGMGLTVLAEPTPALSDLAEKGAFTSVNRSNLLEKMEVALTQLDTANLPPTSHAVFFERLSLDANRAILEDKMQGLLRIDPAPLDDDLHQLAEQNEFGCLFSDFKGCNAEGMEKPCRIMESREPVDSMLNVNVAGKSIEEVIQLAQEAMAQDDWTGAYLYWKSLLERPNKDLSIQLLLRISRELFKLDAFPDAASALSRAEKMDSEHPGVICEKASQYYYHCYSSWLMLVTENEPEWYKADGLDTRPDWTTACELIERAEEVAPRNNLRRYVQAYLLLAEEAWATQQTDGAHDALSIALSAIGSQKLCNTLVDAIFESVDQFRHGLVDEKDPYCQTLQDHIDALSFDLLSVQEWLCLNDILNWNGLLVCGYAAREKALDLAIAKGKGIAESKEILKVAMMASLDRNDASLAYEFLTKLKQSNAHDIEVLELESCYELMIGNLEAFRKKWPHSPTPTELRVRNYLKGKSVALVGPAPTGTVDGEEIDSYDVVIRMNWRGEMSVADPREFGERTTCSLYNSHSTRLLRISNYKNQLNELDYILLRTKIYYKDEFFNYPEKIWGISDRYPSFHKSLNAIPFVLFKLLFANVKKIKLFKVNFYSTFQHHVRGYRKENNLNSLKALQPVIANHDLISQLNTLSLLNNSCISKLHPSIYHLLLINRKSYIKQICSNMHAKSKSESKAHIPNIKLEKELSKLKKRRPLKISIVGNSPILQDSKMGKLIDEADIVIRINNYVTKGYEKDVGSKTDFVLITPATLPNKELLSIPTHKIIVFCNDKFEDLKVAQDRINLDNGCRIDLSESNILDLGVVKKLSKELGLKDRQWPSTGMLAIIWCLEVFKESTPLVNLFGFSFFKESGDQLKHYYGIETKRDNHHDFLAEEKFVLNLHNQQKVNLISNTKNIFHAKKLAKKTINIDPDIVIASHYEKNRSTSPCVSVYHAFLNNADYKADVSYLYTKTSKYDYEKSLCDLLTKKRLFLFNGICSYLQNDYVIDSFKKIFESGSTVGVYWHETSWNINRFRKVWQKNWEKSIEFFKKYSCFHLVPTSQNKQLVMLLTETDIEKIRVVFETIPDIDLGAKRNASRSGPLKIIGSGIPDERKGFDIFKRLSVEPEFSDFKFIWHWHENINKVKQRFGGIGRIDYQGFVENFGIYLKDNADLFLLTSRDDPSPIVALEALRSDVPVICFDSTGYAEVLPSEYVARSYQDMKEKILNFFVKAPQHSNGFFYDIYKCYTPDNFLKKANLSDFFL